MADRIEFDEELNLGSRGGAMAWLEYAATMGLMAGVSRLPRGLQMMMLRAMAGLAMRLDKRHRRAARGFMSQALGEEIGECDGRIKQAYVHLFRVSVDSHAFDRKVPQSGLLDHFNVQSTGQVRAAWESGQGGIIVACHVGDWEAGAAVMPHVGMDKSYVIARPPKNRYLSRHLLRVRERKQITVMPRRGAMKQIASVLRDGGWIAMLLDQRPRGKHSLAPFFGRLTTCERSAGVLFKRMGVPIVYAACYLTDRPFHYDMQFLSMITPEELEEMSPDEILAAVNAKQEELILAHPEQYFWLHDRYRDAPAPTGLAEEDKSPSPGIPSR